MSKVSKSWKFTLNNWVEKDRKFFENLDASVVVFGEEIGCVGSTPHLQGHVTFKRAYRLTALKKLHEKAHWEVAMCSDFNYEMKGDNVFIKDNRKQGKRTDLDTIGQRIKEGATAYEIAREYPSQFIRYHKGIKELIQELRLSTEDSEYSLAACCDHLNAEPLEFNGVTEVIIGPSGCGKTQFALAHFIRPLLVSHMDDLKDFKESLHDGIVFDDMDFRHMPRTAQIHLVDWSNRRSIHARYLTASIPKHTKKIITCNTGSYPLINDPAVNRRVHVTEVCER